MLSSLLATFLKTGLKIKFKTAFEFFYIMSYKTFITEFHYPITDSRLFGRLGFTARQDYFSHFEPSQSIGGAQTGDLR